MNSTITKCVCRAGGILHKSSISLCAAPRSTIPAQNFKPLLPRTCFAPRAQIFTPSRLLSTTSGLLKKGYGATADWNSRPIPDAHELDKRVDNLEDGIESAGDAKNRAGLLEEGTTEDLPNTEETAIKKPESLLDIGEPINDRLLGELYGTGYEVEYDEEDQGFDEDEEGDAAMEYDRLEELSDEEIDELIEEAEEKQDDECGWELNEDFEDDATIAYNEDGRVSYGEDEDNAVIEFDTIEGPSDEEINRLIERAEEEQGLLTTNDSGEKQGKVPEGKGDTD